ncbi:hypothetical protein ABPG73_006303 [Tetrahymena malaccensis]
MHLHLKHLFNFCIYFSKNDVIISHNTVLKFSTLLFSFLFYNKYIVEDSSIKIEITIDIFSRLFRNAETKGLQVFNTIKQVKSIKHIIIRLIQGYSFKEIENKPRKPFTKSLTISQQKNYFLYSLYKNPNVKITLTFFSLQRDQKSFINITTGNSTKNRIRITKLRICIFQSSEELPHSRLRSMREYDLFLSRLRQKKLDRVFSNNIEQNTMINMQIKVRRVAQSILLNSIFFHKNNITDTIIVIEHIKTGIMNITRSSENPMLADSGLYYDIKQFKEKNGELKGLQNKNQS